MQNRKKQDDLKINRLMMNLTISFMVAIGLIAISRQLLGMNTIIKGEFANKSFYQYMTVGKVLAIALFAASIIYLIVSIVKKIDTSQKVLTPIAGMIWSGLMLLAVVAIDIKYQYAISVCYILLLAYCVIYLIKNVYNSDFYILSYGLAAGIYGFYVLYKVGGDEPFQTYVPLGTGILIAACALAGVLLYMIKKKGGKLGKTNLFGNQCSYWPVFTFLGATALGLAAVLVWGAPAAYYAMFAMVGFAIACAVYFTVRQMIN